jgi:sacsin
MSLIASAQLPQEEFAQREPLMVRLRGLVRSYPKGVGLIQEFLQNADDAGAKSLRVYLDSRSYSSTALPAASMAVLQGPALVVVNDAAKREAEEQLKLWSVATLE